MRVHPPQKVVREVIAGRFLEGLHKNPLWVDARKNVLYASIFASGVHRLKYDQNAVFVLGMEHFLQGLDFIAQLFEQPLAAVPIPRRDPFDLIRIDLAQVRFCSGLDDVSSGELRQIHAQTMIGSCFYDKLSSPVFFLSAVNSVVTRPEIAC
jgi:hypothetical protein